MIDNMQRCESAAQIATIAARNHVPYRVNPWAASVVLGEVVYFWSAA